MARLLLAHPLFLTKSPDEQRAASPYFPLGLLYLAAYARDSGHDVAVFDGTFEEDESAFDRALTEHEPDLVGLAALQPTRSVALTLAEMAKARGIVTVLGGPDPTRDPAVYAAHPAVDLVVHHEGEQTLVALLDVLDAGGSLPAGAIDEPGVAIEVGASVIVNAPRPPIEDLDALPLPARDLIDMDRYLQTWEDQNGYGSVTIATTRGCPYGCSWCADAVHGDGFRQRSPENVAAEVAAIKEQFDPRRLRLVDDVDGIERDWFDAWVDAGADVPFEPLNNIARRDLPLLEMADPL